VSLNTLTVTFCTTTHSQKNCTHNPPNCT